MYLQSSSELLSRLHFTWFVFRVANNEQADNFSMAFPAIKHAFGFENFMESSVRFRLLSRQPSWSMNHRPPAGFPYFYSQRTIIHNAKLFCENLNWTLLLIFSPPAGPRASGVFFQAVFTLSGTPERGKLYTRNEPKEKPTWVRKKNNFWLFSASPFHFAHNIYRVEFGVREQLLNSQRHENLLQQFNETQEIKR